MISDNLQGVVTELLENDPYDHPYRLFVHKKENLTFAKPLTLVVPDDMVEFFESRYPRNKVISKSEHRKGE